MLYGIVNWYCFNIWSASPPQQYGKVLLYLGVFFVVFGYYNYEAFSCTDFVVISGRSYCFENCIVLIVQLECFFEIRNLLFDVELLAYRCWRHEKQLQDCKRRNELSIRNISYSILTEMWTGWRQVCLDPFWYNTMVHMGQGIQEWTK